MALAESIYAKLADAASATAALIGSGAACRLWPGIAPVDAQAPYIVWQVIAVSPDTTLGEAAASGNHLIQFSIVAGSYIGARDIGVAITTDLDNATLAASEVVLSCDAQDGYSEATDQFLRIVEASIFVPSAA